MTIENATPTEPAASASADGAALRALRILEAVATGVGPHRLGHIAAETGVSKPSVHRILAQLGEAGFVSADGFGRYAPGPRSYALAARLSGAHGVGAESILRQFQSDVDNTVHVGLRSGNQAVYVNKIEGNQPYRMASHVGMQLPLHSTAIGKAILAYLPASERAQLLAEVGMPARTPATLTDLDKLEANLAEVRDRGYAVDDEENEPTIRCVAAALLDRQGRPIGGLSISTVTFLVTSQDLLALTPRLAETAALLAPWYVAATPAHDRARR
ncbi:IclR family transcriptional regulator [Fodinicola feengrottensis]|uniref:IclR family transcriptional regulator n=1 Tax=Fodinicola feengrottensis TaxID=435914 RepID=A0ABN2HP00_9ACTN|nr:IclR family transcriptional regulator [Fodinicola feengrottensis]